MEESGPQYDARYEWRACLRSQGSSLLLGTGYETFKGRYLLSDFLVSGRFVAYQELFSDATAASNSDAVSFYQHVRVVDLRSRRPVLTEQRSERNPGTFKQVVLSTRGQLGLIVARPLA